MNPNFTNHIMQDLFQKKILSIENSILVIGGGEEEKDFFIGLNFKDVVITNIFTFESTIYEPYKFDTQNAQNLTYTNKSFDFVFVSAALHHCSSPHKALLEMYRVARKGIIVIEARDSMIMKVANLVKLSPTYEIGAAIDGGGVNGTFIPNYIYRWTEREFEKVLNSYNPVGKHTFLYYHEFTLPFQAAKELKSGVILLILKLIQIPAKIFSIFFPRQGNLFGMVAINPVLKNDLWPWLKIDNSDDIVLNRDYLQKIYKKV